MNAPTHYHYDRFPPVNINYAQLLPFIGPAHEALARYDGKLSAVPNPNILLTPLTTQEAVLSSRIEGTQATMGEVFEYEAEEDAEGISEIKKGDINEILNYRKAMWKAEKALTSLPLCQRVIKKAHEILLDGVRGHGKAPGEYRKMPNWIGPPGCSIDEAQFVPISADKLPEAMGRWEKFLHGDEPDRLIQLGVLHAEFEALHPFLDGNGRLGRMLVPLYLSERKLIHRPLFYISAYFESNRDEYYSRLLAISRDNDWTQWCAFFLKAIAEQAKENLEKTESILDLYEKKKNFIVEITHSQYGIHALDFIFSRPIFKTTDFVSCNTIPPPTAKRIIKVLRDNGIIKTLRKASGRRSAIYTFSELLNIAEGRSVF